MKKSTHSKASRKGLALVMFAAVALLMLSSLASFATGAISGKVFDASNLSLVVANATVTLSSGDSVTTNDSGIYTFSNVAVGTYGISVTAEGYISRSVVGIVADGSSTAKRDISLVAYAPITDTFSRTPDPTTSLGTTEDATKTPWIKSSVGGTTEIVDNLLCLRGDGSADGGVSIGSSSDTSFANVDMSVTYHMPTQDGFFLGNVEGITYRQPDSEDWGGGYWVYLTPGNDILLRAPSGVNAIPNSQTNFGSSLPGFSWTNDHTVRVRVYGDHHQVWVDDVKMIDVHHSEKTTGGYIGIFRDPQSEMDVSKFTAFNIPDCTIHGVVKDSITSAPLANAEISLSDGQNVTADSNGNYSAKVAADANDFVLIAAAAGHTNKSVSSINLLVGDLNQDIALDKLPDSMNVYDNFNRADSTNLGTSQDTNHYVWQSNSGEKIYNNTLWETWGANNSVSLAGFQPSDVDYTFTISGYVTGGYYSQISTFYRCYDPLMGYCYRIAFAPEIGNVYFSSQQQGKPNYDLLSTSVAGIDFTKSHTVHVRAIGNRHQLWIDGNQLWDVYDNNQNAYNGPGYILLGRVYNTIQYDDFRAAGNGLLKDPADDAIPVANAAAVKSMADGTIVKLTGLVVTGKFSGYCYAEDANRASGIKIIPALQNIKDVVDVVGSVSTKNGEKFISVMKITKTGTADVAPLGSSGRAFAKNSGLSNVGLLMKTWGKVTKVADDNSYMYVDDGSNLSDNSGNTGIKVILSGTYDPSLAFVNTQDTKPSVGDNVSVAGIVCLASDGSGYPVIQARSAMDIHNVAENDVVVHQSEVGTLGDEDKDANGNPRVTSWKTLVVKDGDFSPNPNSYVKFVNDGVECYQAPGELYAVVSTRKCDGMLLKDLTALKFSEFMSVMPDLSANRTFMIEITIDTNNDGIADTSFTYEPYYHQGSAISGIPGTWQEYDAVNDGLWTSWDANLCRENPKPFSYWITSVYPDAKIQPDHGGWGGLDGAVRFYAGNYDCQLSGGFVGTLGNVTIGTKTSGTTTYNFAP